jgi:hypothetical protein
MAKLRLAWLLALGAALLLAGCGPQASIPQGIQVYFLDDYLILTGSFNFTKAAEEHNAENLLLINDPVLAKPYIENWRAHEQHSEPYDRESKPAERTGRPKRD